jgi:hypothetical protein
MPGSGRSASCSHDDGGAQLVVGPGAGAKPGEGHSSEGTLPVDYSVRELFERVNLAFLRSQEPSRGRVGYGLRSMTGSGFEFGCTFERTGHNLGAHRQRRRQISSIEDPAADEPPEAEHWLIRLAVSTVATFPGMRPGAAS